MAIKIGSPLTTAHGITGLQVGGGATWTPGNAQPSPYSGLSVSIAAYNNTGRTAPAGVMFKATTGGAWISGTRPSYYKDDQQWHDHNLRFRWEFDDAGATYSAAPRSAAVWGSSSNVAYGRDAAHTFETAGTFTVRCYVTDGVTPEVYAETTVTVNAPNTVFADAETFYFAHDGVFDGEAAGAANQINSTDIAANWPALVNGKRRVRIKKGGTYAGVGSPSFASGRTLIDAWGSGADPLISTSNGSIGLAVTGTFTEVGITGIDIRGTYNPVDWSGQNGQIALNVAGNGPITVHKTKARWGHRAMTVQSTAADTNSTIVISDSVVMSGGQYTVWNSETFRVAVIGSWVGSDPDSLQNSPSTGAGWRNGRTDPNGMFLVSQADWFNNTGGSQILHQPPMRLNTNGQLDARASFSQCVMEGGDMIFAKGAIGNDPHNREDLVLDKMIFLGTPGGQQVMKSGNSGYTLKNFLIIWPYAPQFAAYPGWLIQVDAIGALTPEQEGSFMHNYSGSVLYWTDPGLHGGDNVPVIMGPAGSSTADLIEENNIFHGPNLSPAQDISGNLDATALATKLFDPIFYRRLQTSHNSGNPDTSYAVPATFDNSGGGGSATQPTAALPVPSSGLTYSAGRIAVDDLLGNLRPTMGAHRGALE